MIPTGDDMAVANEGVACVGEGVYQGYEYPASELPGPKPLQACN